MKPTNPVPRGYKRTKVGVIPEEWEVVKLGDVFDFIKTYSNSRSHLSQDGEIEYIHYGDIHTKFKFHLDLQKERLPRISKDKIKGEPSYVKEGDLIIADASEDYADIGKSIEVINIGDKKVVSGLHTFLLRDKSNYFANGYKGFLLYNEAVSKSMKKIATGVSVLGISKTNLSKIKIPLPPLKEQQKIAQILSTWDEAIAKLEALIEEKERFKKGLMQKLLSVELRFPSFEGEWEEVRLGDVATVIMGQSPSSKSYNEEGKGAPLIQGNADCENRKTSPRMYTTEQTKMCKKGDIIMTVRAPVGYVSKSYHNACIGRGVCVIRPHSQNDFLYYFLIMYEERWKKFSQGSTFTAVNSQDIKRLKVPYPSIEEQEKIVEVLSELDRETKLLKEELGVFKEQKRGLMRKLLEGIVRVKG